MTIDSQFTFDTRDAERRTKGLALSTAIDGPRVGAFVLLPCETMERISLMTGRYLRAAELARRCAILEQHGITPDTTHVVWS